MGFLDKLFGRAKDTAGDTTEKSASVVDKAEDAAERAWDKTSDAGSDAVDEVKGTVGGASDEAKETVDEASGGEGRPGPPPAA